MLNQNYPLSKPINKDDHTQGLSQALINMLEYGDYQCPYCGQAYYIVKHLQKDFPDQIAFTFRNFPLTQIHQNAFKAAEAAEIAADSGKFWEMHDLLFENQEFLEDVDLLKYANKIGLNENDFIAKMYNQSKADRVKTDFLTGVDSGVNGTPSFFINGYKYDGDFSYDAFKQLLNEILNNSNRS